MDCCIFCRLAIKISFLRKWICKYAVYFIWKTTYFYHCSRERTKVCLQGFSPVSPRLPEVSPGGERILSITFIHQASLYKRQGLSLGYMRIPFSNLFQCYTLLNIISFLALLVSCSFILINLFLTGLLILMLRECSF